jgi:hypothetical protein
MEGEETPVAEKTPDTPAPEKPVEKPAEPTSEPTHDDSLRQTVARLEGVVEGLSQRVEQIVTRTPQDERPVSMPWTHKRF